MRKKGLNPRLDSIAAAITLVEEKYPEAKGNEIPMIIALQDVLKSVALNGDVPAAVVLDDIREYLVTKGEQHIFDSARKIMQSGH